VCPPLPQYSNVLQRSSFFSWLLATCSVSCQSSIKSHFHYKYNTYQKTIQNYKQIIVHFYRHALLHVQLLLSIYGSYRLLPIPTNCIIALSFNTYLFFEQRKRYYHLLQCCHLADLCCTAWSAVLRSGSAVLFCNFHSFSSNASRNYACTVRPRPTRWTDFHYIWYGTFQ
jgi:hypothetical protein